MLPVMLGVFWEWLPRVVNIVPITVVTERFVVCFPNAETKRNDAFLLLLLAGIVHCDKKTNHAPTYFSRMTETFSSSSCYSIHYLGNIINQC